MSDDRTAEFLSLARSLPGGSSSSSSSYRQISSSGQSGLQQHDHTIHSKANSNSSSNTSSNPAYAELRNFHQTAAGISKDIAGTSALLSELTLLVRNQSSSSLLLYQDAQHNGRINDLVVRIKMSIENLNSRLDQASVTIAQIKKHRQLSKSSQAGQEVSNLVDGLKVEFAQAASGFKKVLQQRTDTMKESGLLQKQVYGSSGESDDGEDDMVIPNLSLAPPPVFSSASTSLSFGGGGGHQQQHSSGSFPTLDLTSGMMSAGQDTSSALPRPHGINSAPDSGGAGMRNRRLHEYSGGYSTHPDSGNNNFYNNNNGGMGHQVMTPLDIARMEQEMTANGDLTMQLIPDQSYLQQRADAMSTIEANIVELGTIFNRLAVVVSEHSELVQRVEDNVEEANTNVNLSLAVLTDTLTNLRSNKQLALRLFSILVIFIIIFIIFFA